MLPLHYRYFLLAFSIAVGAWTCEAAPSPRRNKTTAPKILVVDLEAVYKESRALQSIQSQLKQWTRIFQESAQTEENILKKKWALLEKTKKLELTPQGEATPEKKAFDEHFAAFLQLHRRRPEALEKAQIQAVRTIKTTLTRILDAIAQHENSAYIMRVQSLAWFDTQRVTSITQRVLTRLNALLPQVKLEVSAKELGITPPPALSESKPK